MKKLGRLLMSLMQPLRRHLRFLLPPVIVAVSIGIAVILTLAREPLEINATELPRISVEVAVIKKREQQIILRSQGTVSPRVETLLSAEVRGRVVEVSPKFVTGGFFNADDVLLRLDDRDYQAAVKQAEAEVASARSSLAVEQGRADAAYQDWLTLNQDNRSRKATDLALRKPQLAEAAARLESSQARLERARLDLERTVIRAPYSGLVRQQNVNIGQYVNDNKTLGIIFAVDYAEVRLPLADNKLDYLDLPDRDGQVWPPVMLSADIGERTHQWQGQIVRTEGVLDERSRTLFAIAQVADPYGLLHSAAAAREPLRFGTFVIAEIKGRTLPNIVILPRNVLRPGSKIWVVDVDNRLRDRVINALHVNSEQIYVRSGLEDGDRACLSPVGDALPGTPVEIIRETTFGQAEEKKSATAMHRATETTVQSDSPPS